MENVIAAKSKEGYIEKEKPLEAAIAVYNCYIKRELERKQKIEEANRLKQEKAEAAKLIPERFLLEGNMTPKQEQKLIKAGTDWWNGTLKFPVGIKGLPIPDEKIDLAKLPPGLGLRCDVRVNGGCLGAELVI